MNAVRPEAFDEAEEMERRAKNSPVVEPPDAKPPAGSDQTKRFGRRIS